MYNKVNRVMVMKAEVIWAGGGTVVAESQH